MSPSSPCAKSVMPTVALLPSTLIHSWSLVYLSPSGIFMVCLIMNSKIGGIWQTEKATRSKSTPLNQSMRVRYFYQLVINLNGLYAKKVFYEVLLPLHFPVAFCLVLFAGKGCSE